MQTGMGSSSGNAMRTSEVTVRFDEPPAAGQQQSNGFPSNGSDAGATRAVRGVKRLKPGLGAESPSNSRRQSPPFHI
jgi:hypothetical protein